MPLRTMIHDPDVGIASLARLLEAMTWSARRVALRGLSRRDQRRLYEKAAAAAPLAIDAFAPRDEPVVHVGRNTLPLPPPFRDFEKHFARPREGGDRAYGFNEGTSRPLLGPGYFVARPIDPSEAWWSRGSVVVDYYVVPDTAVPAVWPRVVPNTRGLQRFVYHHTRDFMRDVGAGVTIGSAYKGETALDHYFVLLRSP